MVGGEAGDAQIDQFVAHVGLDAAVLGHAVLRDGHVGLYLQPADDGRLEAFGRGLYLVQHAVNPVADAKGLGQRLKVNVRGAHPECLGDHGVDQPDQRRVGIHHGTVRRGGACDLDVLFGQFLDGLLELRVGRYQPRSPALAAVVLAESGLDVLLRSNAKVHFRVQEQPQAVECVQVGRVCQGDRDVVVVLENRHDPVLASDMAGNGRDDVVVNLNLTQVDDFGPKVGGLGLGNVGRTDHLVGHHQVHHPYPGGLGLGALGCHLLRCNEPKVHQNIYQIIVFLSHSSFSNYSRFFVRSSATE